MFRLPSIPPWVGLHPVAVHLPLGALFVVPALLLAAMLIPRLAKGFALSALLVLLLGTLGVVLAVQTGDAASDSPAAPLSAAADAVLESHEEMAEATQTIFFALAGLLVVLVGVWLVRGEKVKYRAVSVALGVYLLAYSVGLLALANTGHEGGRLVHEFGVRARIGASQANAAGTDATGLPPASQRRHDDDD